MNDRRVQDLLHAYADATTLARSYFRRWPVQENVIRDFLIPLGIDTNHGYGKREVVNSEVAKRRSVLSERLERLKRCRPCSSIDNASWRSKR